MAFIKKNDIAQCLPMDSTTQPIRKATSESNSKSAIRRSSKGIKEKRLTPENIGARTCADLEQALNDPHSITRRWAARDLAACPQAATALVGQLERETEDSVREVILTSLTRLGDATAVAGLVHCLRSEDVALRNAAIEAMQHLPNEVAPMMQDLLGDPDPDVRIIAVNILESLRHPDVETWLISVIDHDLHLNVCATAVDLLSEVGSAAAIAALNRLKTRFASEPYIQFAADLALTGIGAS